MATALDFTSTWNVLLHTHDGGLTWQKHDSLRIENSPVEESFAFVNESLGFLMGEGNFLYKTTDGGLHWETLIRTETEFLGMVFFDEQLGYASKYDLVYTNESGIYKTENGGFTWTRVLAGLNEHWYFVDEQHGLVLKQAESCFGGGGLNFYPNPSSTSDAGLSWEVSADRYFFSHFAKMYFATPEVGYFFDDGKIYRLEYRG